MDERDDSGGSLSAQELEAVRVRARLIMEEEGLTLTSVSRQSAISVSVLSPFMDGKYKGDNQRVARQLLKWADGRAALAALEPVRRKLSQYVETTTARRISATLTFARGRDMAMIAGSPGIGKTTAARQFQAVNTNVWLATMTAATKSVPAVMNVVAAAIGIHDIPRNAHGAFKLICRRLDRTDGLLIIDEGQHLTELGFEQIRAIHDEIGVGVAFLGHLNLEAKIARLEHLSSRVSAFLVIDKSCAEDVDSLLDVAGIECPRSRTFLRGKAKVKGLRRIVSACRDALYLAAAEGAPAVTIRHVTRAWAELGNPSE